MVFILVYYALFGPCKHEVGLSTASNPAFRNEGERFPSLAALFPPGDERHAWLHDSLLVLASGERGNYLDYFFL